MGNYLLEINNIIVIKLDILNWVFFLLAFSAREIQK